MATDRPTFRVYTIRDLVVKADPEHYENDKDVYEFSNGRKFESTDRGESGIYE